MLPAGRGVVMSIFRIARAPTHSAAGHLATQDTVSRCTASTRGRTLQIGEHDQLLAQARTDWRDRRHTDDYRQHRPMVERSIAWLVRNGHRRVRYRGVTANRIGLAHRAAAVNLQRLTKLGADHNGHTWQLNAA